MKFIDERCVVNQSALWNGQPNTKDQRKIQKLWTMKLPNYYMCSIWQKRARCFKLGISFHWSDNNLSWTFFLSSEAMCIFYVHQCLHLDFLFWINSLKCRHSDCKIYQATADSNVVKQQREKCHYLQRSLCKNMTDILPLSMLRRGYFFYVNIS